MKVGCWCTDKPVFDMECIFATASLFAKEYYYSIWEIKKCDGENDRGEPAWYYGLLDGDGDEWGDIDDLKADKYLILPPLNIPEDAKHI